MTERKPTPAKSGTRVEVNAVVTLAYTLTDEMGNELEVKSPEEPAIYIHGHGHLLAAVEDAIEGQTAGFTKTIKVDPEQSYGQYQPELVVDLPRDQFPQNMNLQIGMKFNTAGPNGEALVVRVAEFDDEIVTVDGNHPLAGVPLVFEVRVLDVRPSTEEEKKSGFVMSQKREHLH